MTHKATRERELSALFEGLEDEGLEEGIVITLVDEGEVSQRDRHVTLIPAWRWGLFGDRQST